MDKRKILVEFEFDPKYWSDENDVCDELIMEDVLHHHIYNNLVGVSYQIKQLNQYEQSNSI